MASGLSSSRRQFVQTALTTAALGGVFKLGAGCSRLPQIPGLTGGDRSETYNILCCDGGGLKGLITAILLEHLEAKLAQVTPDRPWIKDHFQLFAGTSTGSIIACGLAKGISATKIRQFYEENARHIFPDPTVFEGQIQTQLIKIIQKAFKRISGLDASRPALEEESETLEKILQEVFGSEDTLDSLDRGVVAVAYDVYNRKPILLENLGKNVENGRNSGQVDARKTEIWKVCRASSAVPGVFTSFFLDEPTLVQSITANGYGQVSSYEERSGLPLIDGFVVTNNPSLWAIQAARSHTNKPLLLVSLGTGQMRTPFSPKDIAGWGLLDWFNPLQGLPMLDVILGGNADTVDSISQQLLDGESSGKYLRYQPNLNPKAKISAFVSSQENLDNMKAEARLYLDDQGGDRLLYDLAQRLAV